MVNREQEPSHTCGEREAKEEVSPSFEKLSGKQSEQDLGSCPNSKESAGDMDECEDVDDHVSTSSIRLSCN
jgi:hypothetical protein